MTKMSIEDVEKQVYKTYLKNKDYYYIFTG